VCERIAWPAVVMLLVASFARAAAPTAADRELFAAADLQRAAPGSLHVDARVEPLAGGNGMSLQLWRAGDDALLRFTDARQRGKAYLRRGGETWFLAPGARPVKLGGAQRLAAGIDLQEIVGLDWERDFELVDVRREGAAKSELVSFDLRARTAGAPFARVTYVVRAASRQPVRIEYRTPSGKVARIVELAAWMPGRRLAPAELLVKDLVGGRPPVRVRFANLAEAAPPPHLFELGPEGEQARASLH